MEELEKEIQKLDTKLAEMQQTMENIKGMVRTQEKESIIDIQKLSQYAKANALKKHTIAGLDQNLAWKYCCALASAVNLEQDVGEKVKQLMYVLRIYHACSNKLDAQAFMRDYTIFAVEDWNSLFTEMNLKERENLLVDFLIMLGLQKRKSEKQWNFFLELIALTGLKRQEVHGILQVAKAILEQDMEQLFDLNALSKEINQYKAYFKEAFDYYVVAHSSEIVKVNEKKICVWKETIRDKNEMIDLDSFGKEALRFEQCNFSNIRGLISEHAKLDFHKCDFTDCVSQKLAPSTNWLGMRNTMKYESNNEQRIIFDLQKATFEQCAFLNCVAEGYDDCSCVFRLKESKLRNCKFENCRAGVISTHNPQGSVICLLGSTMENCHINACNSYGETTYGSYANYYIRIVASLEGGLVRGNTFKDCVASAMNSSDKCYNNYILAYSDDGQAVNNTYENCQSEQCVYSSNYSSELEVRIKSDEPTFSFF